MKKIPFLLISTFLVQAVKGGDIKKAQENYEKALKLDSTNQSAKDASKRIKNPSKSDERALFTSILQYRPEDASGGSCTKNLQVCFAHLS